VSNRAFHTRFVHVAAEEKKEVYDAFLHFNAAPLCQDPKLAAHVELMRKCHVPDSECKRYAETIISHLAGEDMDDGTHILFVAITFSSLLNNIFSSCIDVRNLAMACLADWIPYAHVEDRAATLWYKEVTNLNPLLLTDPRSKTQKVFDARWTFFANMLMMVTGYKSYAKWTTFNRLDRSRAQPVTRILMAAMTSPSQDRATRFALFKRVEEWIRIPNKTISGGRRRDDGDCVKLDNPIFKAVLEHRDGALFWRVLASRRYDSLDYGTYTDTAAVFEKELRRYIFSPSFPIVSFQLAGACVISALT
jgi:hypothetical protein